MLSGSPNLRQVLILQWRTSWVVEMTPHLQRVLLLTWDFVGLVLWGNSTLYWHNGETARKCSRDRNPFPLLSFFFNRWSTLNAPFIQSRNWGSPSRANQVCSEAINGTNHRHTCSFRSVGRWRLRRSSKNTLEFIFILIKKNFQNDSQMKHIVGSKHEAF